MEAAQSGTVRSCQAGVKPSGLSQLMELDEGDSSTTLMMAPRVVIADHSLPTGASSAHERFTGAVPECGHTST